MKRFNSFHVNVAVFITGLLFFSIACFSQSPASWKNYRSGAFQLSCPPSWTIDTSKKQGAEVFLFSQLTDSLDVFRENVNVLIQNLEGLGIDLKKYTSISEQQIREMSADAAIELSENITNKQGTFQRIIYSASTGGYKLKFEQHYFVQKAKAYVITFTGEIDKFEQYKAIAEQILASFKLN